MRQNKITELIAIGETMVLVTPVEAVPLETATNFQLAFGGAESNVAMHFAALGHSASWVSQVGDDALGRRLHAQISGGGVDTKWSLIHPSAPTGVYFKDPGRGVQYFRTGSAASHMGPEILHGIPLEQAAVVHISGITPALSQSCDALVRSVMERVGKSAACLSFDINHRSGLWAGRDAGSELREFAAQADIVFVGLDEAQALWGIRTPQDVRDLLPDPAVLVVKDGGVGATEFLADRGCFVPAIPTDVVEAVGAGDAFAAGYLSAYLRGLGSAQRLRSGHDQAVLVLKSTSDLPHQKQTLSSNGRTAHADQQ